ncbi:MULTISPECIES: ParB/RepB/Spo0J family partition protein [unclassified Gemella]|uniref:ParB/RepB/Spo0J family partition protein n=1 Tax=unclassified Gemella TaxID=2624949 RepID=UPI001D16A7FE|nr:MULTISPECIES: ParB/RepB/Spo0J family partition protein [unclassified Gemella]
MADTAKPFDKLYSLSRRAEKVGIADEDILKDIALSRIIPNRYQPRREFDDGKIKELAESIKQNGLLQSITVRDLGDGYFELIAGERRFRALQSLEKVSTKAIVKELTDEQMATLALIENIQREELSPIEEANAYIRLLEINNITQGELAKSLGKTQATVANKIRLLKLCPKVIEAISSKKITERHGRAMVKLDHTLQEKILNQILVANLNVLQTEEKINQYLELKNEDKHMDITYDSQKIVAKLLKEIRKLEEKYDVSFDKEESEGMDHIEISIKVPRYKF